MACQAFRNNVRIIHCKVGQYHLVFLPPYSPEVQPAERLWPLSNEPLANRVFPSLNELEEVQAER